MTVRIIIPAYKNPEQLEKCLQAISANQRGGGIDWTVQVVDNSENNIGFTKAVNVGLRSALKAADDFAIILNQDCYLNKDAIINAVSFMELHPKCAIAGIKQLSSVNEDLIIHGGCVEAYPTGRHLSGLVSKGDCSKNKQMPWANGACLIVRVSLIPEFGLMDEGMFLVGSDSDWSYTARSRGFEVWYIADAVCVHEQGVTSGERNKEAEKAMYLDMIYWRNKWVGTDLFRELTLEVFD